MDLSSFLTFLGERTFFVSITDFSITCHPSSGKKTA